MKRRTWTGLIMLSGIMVVSACGNASKTTSKNETVQTAAVQESTQALEVDMLLAQAEALVGHEVVVEAVCTHICAHGGKKIFLMGSDDTQTIRVESGNNSAFKNECVNSIVKVTGKLVEDRIDEAYLQAWEAKLKATTAEHGNGGGCDTEKNARGETSNTGLDRIADFRSRIEKRKNNTGKDYLSFYHIEAVSYEIQP